jgi:hypothetical protein
MDGSGNPLVLALHFAVLALPALLVSGPAGVATDKLGCEAVLSAPNGDFSQPASWEPLPYP